MIIKYDSKGKKLKKPFDLSLKELLKRDVNMVLYNLPVISYEELKRPTYTRYLKAKIKTGEFNPYMFRLAKVVFNWDEKTYREFLKWYEEGN